MDVFKVLLFMIIGLIVLQVALNWSRLKKIDIKLNGAEHDHYRLAEGVSELLIKTGALKADNEELRKNTAMQVTSLKCDINNTISDLHNLETRTIKAIKVHEKNWLNALDDASVPCQKSSTGRACRPLGEVIPLIIDHLGVEINPIHEQYKLTQKKG